MTDAFTIRTRSRSSWNGEDLSEAEAAACMEELMTGTATPAQFGAYVTALRMKGETVDEIAGMARVMREKSSRIDARRPAARYVRHRRSRQRHPSTSARARPSSRLEPARASRSTATAP